MNKHFYLVLICLNVIDNKVVFIIQSHNNMYFIFSKYRHFKIYGKETSAADRNVEI